MGGDELPKLQAHSRKMTGHANDAQQQAVEEQHVDGSEAGRDAERKGHETYADVVGHDCA